ncbi:RNA-binding signal recognition particle subunit srp14 [Halocaridina rubra]|uniref:Signal recognition particle 14 kDa protein n=1 Tax=Halocaridina rubra TaxID=373956 RepID=A0AAN8WWD0_HALRR
METLHNLDVTQHSPQTNHSYHSQLSCMLYYSYDGRTRPIPKVRKIRQGKKTQIIRKEPLPTPDEFSCLIRAKSKSKKISTVISAEDAIRFQLQFCQFLRSNMDGLKKEKKTKKKSKKATQ